VTSHFDAAMTKLVGSPEALSVSTITGVINESDDGTTAVCSGTLIKDLAKLCPKLFDLGRRKPGSGGELLAPICALI
jgi:hypothetical protein